jgi:hypothetical protein
MTWRNVVATVLFLAFSSAPTFAAKDMPYLQFLLAFNQGADCPQLYELRNEAKRHGATNEQQNAMNEKLRAVRCSGNTSKRVPDGPPNTGDFTVKEYRIYRDVVDTPMSLSEEQNLGNAAKKYNLSIADVHKTVEKVMRNLSENNWMVGSPASEIRHASDWKGEKP